VGVCQNKNEFPSLLSIWMSNGTVNGYVNKNPKVCLLEIFLGISDGLRYLHSQKEPIVHGDLKAVNVLINSRGRPCLCDFGLSRILVNSTSWNTTASRARGTLRWQAPELLDPKPSQPVTTIESDIYSYGLTCYEVLTGRIPFYQIQSDFQLLFNVTTGKAKLQKPENGSLTEFAWDVLCRCWSFEPSQRPSAAKVYELLSEHDCQKHEYKYEYDRCLVRAGNDANVNKDDLAHGDGGDSDSDSDSE